jgi:D-threo-aldose 1-dehydrogenase
VSVTELGLGTAAIGNLYTEVDDDTAIATVDAAWDCGIRPFDTAPHYGLGLAERRIGAALRQRARADYVLATKVGRRLIPVAEPRGRDTDGFAVPAAFRRPAGPVDRAGREMVGT